MTGDQIRTLMAAGLTPDQMAVVVDMISSIKEEASEPKRRRSEQNRRAYEKSKAMKPADSALNDAETAERVLNQHVPSPSPPSSPIPPPTPTPTPERTTASARGSRSKSADLESQAKLANQQSIPLDLNFDGFPAMWAEWCAYRTDLQRRNPAKAWTAQAASMTLNQCSEKGPKLSCEAIRLSISNGWQGLIWEKLSNGAQPRGRDSPPPRQDPFEPRPNVIRYQDL